MPIQFMTSPKYLLTSESVTEGHPDKVCDQISDAVLDAAFSVDPMSRVACETVAGKNLVMVTGEITTQAELDFDAITRKTLLEIGYTDLKYGIDGHSCGVIANASQQSPDINSRRQHRPGGPRQRGQLPPTPAAPPGRRPGHDGRIRVQRDRWPDAHHR